MPDTPQTNQYLVTIEATQLVTATVEVSATSPENAKSIAVELFDADHPDVNLSTRLDEIQHTHVVGEKGQQWDWDMDDKP